MKKISLVLLLISFTGILAAQGIGLALSGGGVRGLAHVGVLKALEEADIHISYIAGTSSGALIGAMYAIGYSAEEIEQIMLNQAWLEILDDTIYRKDYYVSQKRWLPYSNINFYFDEKYRLQLPQAFAAGQNLINLLFDFTYRAAATRDFNSFNIPFRCTATNIVTGELKVFQEGNLHEAIRASLSFPTVLKPFAIDDSLYIDGGILSNLPAEVVRAMGADYVIGVKANSYLAKQEELNTMIDVLNQTVNVNMQKHVQSSEKQCDLIIEPDLVEFKLLDFDKKKQIIQIGYNSAQKYIKQIKQHSLKPKFAKLYTPVPYKIRIADINIKGNKHLSSSKIKEYLDLSENEVYSKTEIMKAVEEVYNSKLFESIYPVLERDKHSYRLTIMVRERRRRQLGIGVAYDEESDFTLSNTISLTNVLQPNSKLLFNFKLGNMPAVNLDYVKNFGKHYGVYFRIFPNLLEDRFYSYNQDHQKTNSVKSLEYGTTLGVGAYVRDAFILEAYAFHFRKKLYQDIADFTETSYKSTGIGIKAYHESLDDFDFPMQGTQLMAKLSGARDIYFSDRGYKKFWLFLKTFFPYKKWISLKYQFEYGSYFEDFDMNFDPFFIGGIDSFLGLDPKEKSAPIFQINTFALRTNVYKNLYFDLQANVLSLGNERSWSPENKFYYGYGAKLGYKTQLGSIKLGIGFREDAEVQFYLNIGRTTDAFKFSRR